MVGVIDFMSSLDDAIDVSYVSLIRCADGGPFVVVQKLLTSVERLDDFMDIDSTVVFNPIGAAFYFVDENTIDALIRVDSVWENKPNMARSFPCKGMFAFERACGSRTHKVWDPSFEAKVDKADCLISESCDDGVFGVAINDL